MKNNLEDFIQISQKLKKACQVKNTKWKLECIFIIQLSQAYQYMIEVWL